MPPDISGVFSLPPSYRATSGQTIRTEQHNPPLEDIAQALTNRLSRDGSAPMTGDLAMNNRKITGLKKGTSGSDAARVDQVPQVRGGVAGGNLVSFDGTSGNIKDSGKKPSDFATKEQGQRAEVAAPAGAVMHFAMQTPPTGWLKCNGAAVSRTTYAALFAAIGTRFGSTGSGDFRLPDMRGEFVRGWDDGRGVDGGRALGSAQGDMLKAHSHGGVLKNASRLRMVTSDRSDGSTDTSALGSNFGSSTDDVGGNETRPRNIALLVCIKT